MRKNAMTQPSDSQNPVTVTPRHERNYNITPLGYQAIRWLKAQDSDKNDEFTFFCPGCLRVLSSCSCPIDER